MMKSDTNRQTDSNSLLFWSSAYKLSDILFVLDETGVLEALAKGATTPELSSRFGLSERSLALAFSVLKAAKIIERSDEKFHLPDEADELLAMIRIERFMRTWHHERGSLLRALRGDSPRDPLDEIQDPEFFALYARAMAVNGRYLALHILKIIRPEKGATVVDLGGADGAVATELADRVPGLSVLVVDRSQLEEPARKRFSKSTSSERLAFRVADLRQPEALLEDFEHADLVLLLNVAHLLSTKVLEELLERLKNTLRPGARVILFDLFIKPADELGLEHLMLIDWLNCGIYFDGSAQALQDSMTAIGFSECSIRSFPDQVGAFITGTI